MSVSLTDRTEMDKTFDLAKDKLFKNGSRRVGFWDRAKGAVGSVWRMLAGITKFDVSISQTAMGAYFGELQKMSSFLGGFLTSTQNASQNLLQAFDGKGGKAPNPMLELVSAMRMAGIGGGVGGR